MTDTVSCKEAIANTERACGPIDVSVNRTRITRDGTSRKMEADQWRAVFNTNLDSMFNVTRQIISSMLEREFGRIVNISLLNGVKG